MKTLPNWNGDDVILAHSKGGVLAFTEPLEYGWPQSLDHEMGEIRCIQTDAAGFEQSTKCSSAGVR